MMIRGGRPSPRFADPTFMAERVYDARLEQTGWEKAGFDDSDGTMRPIGEAPSIAVSSQNTDPVQSGFHVESETGHGCCQRSVRFRHGPEHGRMGDA